MPCQVYCKAALLASQQDGQTSQQVQFLHLVIKYKHKADNAQQAANQPKWLQLQLYCKNMSR